MWTRGWTSGSGIISGIFRSHFGSSCLPQAYLLPDTSLDQTLRHVNCTMPGLVQKITSAGYGYVAPTLDKARKYVPLVEGGVQRIQPIAIAVIHKADEGVDATYAIVEGRAVAVRGAISGVGDSVYKKSSPVIDRVVSLRTAVGDRAMKVYNENPIFVRAHRTGMSLCDDTEALIDSWLPDPSEQESKASEEVSAMALIPRTIALPFRIPARSIHIMSFKVSGVSNGIVVKVQWALELTKDQKNKFSQHIAEHSRQMIDKVSSSTVVVAFNNSRQTGAQKLEVMEQSLANGKHAVATQCYNVCDRVGLIKVKDITVGKVEGLQGFAASIGKSASKGAYTLTKRIAGDERATVIFTKIGEKVPTVQSAIFDEASAGSLEAMTS